MTAQTSLDHLLHVIGSLTVKLDLAERALAQKSAECEALIEQDSKRLQEEMAARAEAVAGNGQAHARK